jgi:hypothetical protein
MSQDFADNINQSKQNSGKRPLGEVKWPLFMT